MTGTDRTVSRLVLASQLCFGAGLFVCTAIAPHDVLGSDEGGISNFGVHASTVAPFTVAFLGSGLALLVAAHASSTPTQRTLRLGLRTVGWLSIAVLASTYPYKLDGALHLLHVVVATTAVLSEVVLGVWLGVQPRRTVVTGAALVVLCAGAAIAAVTLAGALHVLFAAQVTTSVGFGVLVVSGTRRVEDRSAAR